LPDQASATPHRSKLKKDFLMTRSTTNLGLITKGFSAIAAILVFSATASAFGPCCCFCQEGRCHVSVEQKEVDVKCFDVECEAICIPPLRFPWECGPLKKCGKVRIVKKLTTDKKKKCVCEYDWTAVHCCPDCYSRVRSCCGCNSGGCCDEFIGCDFGCASATDTKAAAGLVQSETALPKTKAQADQSIALVNAIAEATPSDDGWVTIKNPAANSLAADGALIEAQVEQLDK